MKLTIHRGSEEIGGTCVELQSGGSRVLIDFGLPLVDENREQFDFSRFKGKSKDELILSGVLPRIKGLYEGEQPTVNAVLLSHPHQDHYGLLSFINSRIPVYLSEGCKELIEVSHFFGQTNYEAGNVRPVTVWEPFQEGDFNVTPYLVDHSGFAALAFLIEAEGKRIFYSGDFRAHGRKGILFDNMLRRPPQNVSYLLLEGSMMGREEGDYKSEEDIENKLVDLFRNKERMYFMACSSQNIDRLVSVYRACKRSGRIFVIDPYTALVLHKLKKISAHIPQFDWGENMRIFFVPNSYTDKMAEDKSLFKFKSAKITYDQMQGVRNRLVIKDSYLTKQIFSKKGHLEGTTLIYSMWDGYFPGVKGFWEKNHVSVLHVHCSGHAYIDDLKKFVRAIEPEFIIPIHTFFPEKYPELFGDNVMIVKDGEMVEI
ncbi:MAG: MBL fold metallo-hydrolase [Sedimentisphaerales bacterium]|nr:MBL fold metallo-hydrolase [Sedimentisphaerales bacterium]